MPIKSGIDITMATLLPDGLSSDQASPDNEEDNDASKRESLNESVPGDTASTNPADAEDAEDEDHRAVAARRILDHLTGRRWPDFDTLIKDINDEAEALRFELIKRPSMRRDPATG